MRNGTIYISIQNQVNRISYNKLNNIFGTLAINMFTFVSFNFPEICFVLFYCICAYIFTNIFYLKLDQANGVYRIIFFPMQMSSQ